MMDEEIFGESKSIELSSIKFMKHKPSNEFYHFNMEKIKMSKNISIKTLHF